MIDSKLKIALGCGEVLFLYNFHGVRDKDLCTLCK